MPAGGRRRLGWHRLEPEWAARVVAAAGVRAGELVLDVGAGEGALTAPLVAAGARVIAVEVHPGRAARLRARFADAPVTVVQVDAASLRLPRRPFRVVASPPYAISSRLVRLLLASPRLRAADLVLQRALVARCLTGPGPGRGRWGDYELARGLIVPRTAFRPVPRVDSAVLRIRRPGHASGRPAKSRTAPSDGRRIGDLNP